MRLVSPDNSTPSKPSRPDKPNIGKPGKIKEEDSLRRASRPDTSIIGKLGKIKEEHGTDHQAMEERAAEEAFDALSGHVSKGDRGERDKLYARMKRQMASPKDSAQRVIAEEWAKACQNKSRAQQTKMFKLWFSVAGDAKRMVAKWRLSNEETTWSTDAHAWVTRDQLVKHYNNADLADEIITKKMNANLWKPHPEAPDLASARLYFCMYEMKSGETKKRTAAKSVEGTCNMDPENDAEALDAMLKGVTSHINDGAKASDDDQETAETNDKAKKAEKSKKGDAPKKGEKPQKSEKPNANLHGPPESESEKEDDPEDVLESWMTTIMKDVQQARKIQLGLKHQPTQKYQAQALLEEAKKFEDYWSQLNKNKKAGPQSWSSLIKRCHDEIGDFRKQIKVSKGALSGIDEEKTKAKKDGSSKASSSS